MGTFSIGKIVSNLIWRFAERTGNQLVSFVVSIILARLLTPDIFGTIALILVFITILNVFVDSGFGVALIQKKDTDDLDYSTVFYFNIVACSFLYVVMFFAAPAIASFYHDDLLTPAIRVLSITIVISGIRNVQQSYVSRNMQFKRFFFATLGGTIVSALAGISMAYMGYGVWALITQQLVNISIGTLILWLTVKWRPKRMFSLKRLKGLFNYGWKLLVSALIDTMYREVRQLIIGRMYTPTDLGLYNRGQHIPNLIITNINSSIDSILLPVMSKEQDDVGRIRSMTRRSIKVSTYIIAPMMMGLAFVSTPMIRLLLTEKWLPCVPFLAIFCITYMFYPIHTANLNAIKAMGRSDLFLKLEIIKKAVGLAALFSTMWISVMAMAYSMLFVSVASQIINSWPNKKLLNYGYLEQLKDIMPSVVIAVVMGLCVYPIQFIGLPDIATLCIQLPVGVGIYVLLSKLFKIEPFEYLLTIIRNRLNERGKQ